jgi:glutathione S-transferase
MRKSRVRYELFYWPEIQGRGEFIRLALEDAGAPYVDVAREPGGMRALERMLRIAGRDRVVVPFAPPILRAGKLVIAQTAAILHYLGPRLELVPASEAGQLTVLQHQLTLADFVVEAHDAHHPIGSGLYYEDQKREARRRSEQFVSQRLPKFLNYFEGVLKQGPSRHGYLVGRQCCYADLSLFQVVEGLRYAFPNALGQVARKLPRVMALAERVAVRPKLAEYLKSPRRIPFNEQGLFRHYPELDAEPRGKHAQKRSS